MIDVDVKNIMNSLLLKKAEIMRTEESIPLKDGSWEFTFLIHSYESDFNSRAALPALFRFMQHAAWQHAAYYHIGYDDLIRDDLVWVLAGITIKLSEIPRWDDVIKLRTWARGTDRLFALRDFTFHNQKGDQIAAAHSNWLVVNMKTKRPQRLDPFLGKMPLIERQALEESFHTIENFMPPELLEKRSVRVSDVDVYGHMNNTRYIEWIIDTYAFPQYKNMNIRLAEVHFLKEALPDTTLSIWKQQKEDMLYFAIKDKFGKVEHCRIIMKIN